MIHKPHQSHMRNPITVNEVSLNSLVTIETVQLLKLYLDFLIQIKTKSKCIINLYDLFLNYFSILNM